MTEETITAILKVFFMIFFFTLVSFIGTLPFRSAYFKSNPKIRIIGTTFAGALFINVAIIHILPEASDTLEQHLRDGRKTEDGDDISVFPLANLLLMVGFLITIFFTKIMTTHEHLHDAVSHDMYGHDQGILSIQNCPTESLITQAQIKQIKKAQKKQSYMNEAYVLTIAIYFHTIFQGIAIGVQNSLTQFLSIAIAIAFHKWADALSMGCHYKAKKVPKKTAFYLIIGQAALNVVSIGLGWIIAMEGDVIQAIFLSLSAGTFLAISTMQLLSEQLHHRQYKFFKFGLLVLATVFISAVYYVQNGLF